MPFLMQSERKLFQPEFELDTWSFTWFPPTPLSLSLTVILYVRVCVRVCVSYSQNAASTK